MERRTDEHAQPMIDLGDHGAVHLPRGTQMRARCPPRVYAADRTGRHLGAPLVQAALDLALTVTEADTTRWTTAHVRTTRRTVSQARLTDHATGRAAWPPTQEASAEARIWSARTCAHLLFAGERHSLRVRRAVARSD